MPLLTSDNLDRLCAARSGVDSEVYDELLYEVASGIENSGSIGKGDVGALLFWKRLQANTPWALVFNSCPKSASGQLPR